MSQLVDLVSLLRFHLMVGDEVISFYFISTSISYATFVASYRAHTHIVVLVLLSRKQAILSFVIYLEGAG